MARSNTVIKSQYLLYFVFWRLGLALLVAACENIYSRSQTSWTPHLPPAPSYTGQKTLSTPQSVISGQSQQDQPLPTTTDKRLRLPSVPRGRAARQTETAARRWLHLGQIASHVKQTTGNSNLLRGAAGRRLSASSATQRYGKCGMFRYSRKRVFNYYFCKSAQVSL